MLRRDSSALCTVMLQVVPGGYTQVGDGVLRLTGQSYD